MPKLMIGTVVVLDSMVGLAKDMVDTEAMVFNKQHTDSEPIPIMVDTDVLMEAMVDTSLWRSLWRLRTILVRNLSSSN